MNHRSSLLQPQLNIPSYSVILQLIYNWADIKSSIPPLIIYNNALSVLQQLLGKFLVNSLLYIYSWTCTTHLPRVSENANRRSLYCQLKVSVITNNVRRFPPKLQRDLFEVGFCRHFKNPPSNPSWPCKSDFLDLHVSGQGSTRSRPKTIYELHNPRGQYCLQKSSQIQCTERRLFARLHNYHVATRQCRRDLPPNKHQRVVPGDDACSDAERLVACVGNLGVLARDVLRVEFVCPAGVVLEREDRGCDVVLFRDVHGLALVQGFDEG